MTAIGLQRGTNRNQEKGVKVVSELQHSQFSQKSSKVVRRGRNSKRGGIEIVNKVATEDMSGTVEVSRQTMKSSESKEHRQDNSSSREAVEVAKDTRVTVKTEIMGRTIEGVDHWTTRSSESA